MLVNKATPALIAGVMTTALLISGTIGCGDGVTTGDVKGTVTFQNRPVYPGKVLVKDANSGKSYSANLSETGEFHLRAIEPGIYDVAIEPILLGRAGAPSNAKVADPNAPDKLANREEGVPAQYRNANINFPEKFRKLGESGLAIDCSSEFPENPIKLELQ